jgi:hypothetical protein
MIASRSGWCGAPWKSISTWIPARRAGKRRREADADAGGLDRQRRQYIPVVALLAWTTETAAAPARAVALSYPDVRRRYVAPARAIGADRRSLDSPAAQLFAKFRPAQSVVLGDVTVTDLDDLHDIYGYFAEPAYRRGCPLTIVADSGRTSSTRPPSLKRRWATRGRCNGSGGC